MTKKTNTTYAEKLSNPLWQRKRLEVFNRDNFACTNCGRNNLTLHIHHIKYLKGADPWEYENHFLTTLCKVCHKNEHEVIIEPDRKYEHLIIYKEEPTVINRLNIQLFDLNNKLKENISDELMEDVLKNIMFIQQQKKDLLEK